MKKKYGLIIFAVFLFICSRLLYIFFLNESQVETDVKLIEVRYTGLVAKHLIDGLIMPFWDYQYSSYDGGTLLSGLMIVPFFLLFGPSSFALTFYGLVNALLTFLIWWSLACRYFGERAGRILAFLFIFAPPVHIKVNLLPSGNHMEINLFIAVVLFFFFRLFFHTGNSPRSDRQVTADFILLGFFAGVGFVFCYSSAVLLLWCFLFWLSLDKHGLRKKNYVLLVLAFVAGISFIFPRLTLFDSSIKKDIITQWPFANLGEFLPRIGGVLFDQLPQTFAIASPAHLPAYFIFMAAVLMIVVPSRRAWLEQLRASVPFTTSKVRLDDTNKGLFFILFVALYLFIYATSNFNTYQEAESPIQHRYLLLLFPFFFMVITIGIDRLFNQGPRGKKSAQILLVYFFLASLVSTVQQLDLRDARKKIAFRLTGPGYSHEMLGTVICSRFSYNPPKSLSLLGSVPPEDIPAMYRGFGYEFGITGQGHRDEYLTRIADRRSKQEFYKGLLLGAATEDYFKETEAERAYLYELVAVDACGDPEHFGHRLLYYVDACELQDKKDLYRGVGTVLAIQCGLRDKTDFTFIKDRNPADIRAFEEGVSNGETFNTQVLPGL